MLKAQGYTCAICKTSEPRGRNSFHVDHCHTTKVVRGPLCHHCNIGIGNFKEDVEILLRVIQYLKEDRDAGQ